MRHIERAIHDTVMHAPGMTCEEIAARLGRGAQVLRNKANPDQEGHIMGYMEMVAIMAMTGDYSAHHATGDYLESLRPATIPTKPISDITLDTCREIGCVVARVQEVLGGRMTLQIQSNCTNSIDAAISTLTELRRAVANHKDGLRAV